MSTWFWILLAVAALLILLVAMPIRRSLAAKNAAETAAPPIGEFLELPSGRLHYVDEGDGPPVVLVHGNGGTLRHFTHSVVAPLSTDRRVVAIDRPGTGYSAVPPNGDHSLKAQARILKDALDRLGISDPVLVGHSLGGSLALRFALDYPNAAKALVLLAPATRAFSSKPPFRDDAVTSALARKAIAWTIAIPAAVKAREETLSAAFAPAIAPDDFVLAGGGVLTLRPGQIETMLADTAALQPSLEDQQERYGELTPPVTILFGDTDGILEPAEHIDHLRAALPELDVQMIEGGGHMLPITAPDAVVRAIRAAGL
ncbi:MAG: alpha/beta hydrolase [Pseudomonadota bacterium]